MVRADIKIHKRVYLGQKLLETFPFRDEGPKTNVGNLAHALMYTVCVLKNFKTPQTFVVGCETPV